MEAPANLIKKSTIGNAVEIRKIDFVTQFERNWESLREILGIMRPIEKAPGTALTAYKVEMDELQGGASVGEGEDIPFTSATFTPVNFGNLTVEKYAKAVSLEAVEKYGAAVAVDKTDEAFRNELQDTVVGRFYTFAQTGSLAVTATNFQQAIALSIGVVKDKFKKMHKDARSVTVFVNTLDVYTYLGAANITVQNAFGLDYIKNFMGADTVILSSEIAPGKVIAIPTNNIVLYYVDPSDPEFAKLGLNYTVSGETNLIGFGVDGNYKNATGEAYAVMGMTMFAEYLDGIAVATFTSAAPELGE